MAVNGTFKLKSMGSNKVLGVSAVPGGFNLSVPPSEIKDGESPDLLNVWQTEGALTLRPGLCKKIVQDYGKVIDVYPRDGSSILLKRIWQNGSITVEKYGMYILTQKAVLAYDGQSLTRIPNCLMYLNGAWQYLYNDFDFTAAVMLAAEKMKYSAKDYNGVQWESLSDAVYVFGSGKFICVGAQVVDYPFPIGKDSVTADCVITIIDPYVPVLYTNCASNGLGVKAEDRNLLSAQCIQKFTTDKTSTVYHLCDSAIDDSTVSISYCSGGTTTGYSIGPGGTYYTSGSLTITLDRDNGTITFNQALADAAGLGIENNLWITYSKTVRDVSPICNCCYGAWFGGENQGENGGSRVFLAGDGSHPNDLYYSQPDNISYFPETCFIEVGDPDDPVTGLAAQYDILAVFKSGSIYSLNYESTAKCQYPAKEVRFGLGCDMPGTLKHIGDCLMWGSSRSGIYSLKSTAIKDERVTPLVSRNINPKLLAVDTDTLQNACALYSRGCYQLFAGNSVFVWDEETGEFYHWDLPVSVSFAFLLGGLTAVADALDGTIYVLDPDSPTDDGATFNAYWRAKQYGFGQTDTLKKVCRLTVEYVGGGVVIETEASGTGQSFTLVPSQNWASAAVMPPPVWSSHFSFGLSRAPGGTGAFKIARFTCAATAGGTIYP